MANLSGKVSTFHQTYQVVSTFHLWQTYRAEFPPLVNSMIIEVLLK